MDDIARTERSVSNDELDDALKMNVAYKTIQVLGQIIRNFPGSITGSTKLKIVTECYFLGLRSMRVILRILESNSSQIVAFMADALKSKDTSQPAREKRAKRFITLLVEGVCFAVTKHVARSVGAEALEPTYEAVKRKYPDLSVAVIDLAIRMEHFRSFPEKEFEDAVKLADRNILANLVIRHLFIDHVYRFPVTRAVKQRCAGRLALELKTVNLIERERAQR
jgi:hypothetical protein